VKFQRRLPPVWLMGLSNSTLGLNTGITLLVIPQLLSARHMPETRIAAISAAAMSANFWAVIFAPLLDVRLSRRFYATALAGITAILAVVSVLVLEHPLALGIALTLGVATAWLANNALGGWLSIVCSETEKNSLSAWFNIALISGTGVASAVGGELLSHFSIRFAAVLLGAIVFLPTTVFIFIPSSEPDGKLASESFGQFITEIFTMLRSRKVLLVLLLFLSPCGSFGLANLLGGIGNDFHASARVVSLVGGIGVVVAGLAGCLLFPILAKRVPLLAFYLMNAMAGSLFAVGLISSPHSAWTFALALLGLFLFQAVSYAIQVGIIFDVIGRNNPLAATTFSILTAATNVPVTYMMVIDGRGYQAAGVSGLMATDAGISIAVCVLLGVLLPRVRGKMFDSGAAAVARLGVLPQEE
jgi:MFS transporter, PAT family, beta-lactamase induction signal transducer AmpG